MKQDIRIISMQTFSDNDVRINNNNSFRSFAYINKIDVVRVDQKDEISSLKSGYQALQNKLQRYEAGIQAYQTQQTMVVFRDIDDKSSCDQERIEEFWSEKKALFFVTMVNIPICGWESKSASECLIETEKRIKKVFEGKKCLLYYTLEYNEIMLFCQDVGFEEYYKLVMRLNHEKLDDKENYIIDTITLYGFGEEAATLNDSQVSTIIKIGINDCRKATSFLDEHKLTVSCKGRLFGLLGRKDIAIVLEEISVAQLYKFLLDIEDQKFITTFSMNLLTDANIIHSLLGSNLDIKSIIDDAWLEELTKYKDDLQSSYIEFCEENLIQVDNVFLRMIDSISSLIASSRRSRLAEDLAVCLWFPFKHFSKFMCELAKHNLSKHLDWELEFQQSLDTFCQNVMLIENSTVHTNRQFVQIPHCESIAFEMPPKVMAYYTLITQKILSSFNCQDPEICCGAMLAPHLVNELEVEPLFCNDSIEPLQFIIVNISEEMLYDPRRTVAILGHEMAHFAGNEIRCRDTRRRCIYVYHIYNLLIEFVKKYMDQIPTEIPEQCIDLNSIFKLAKKFTKKIIENDHGNQKPLNRELMREISNLRNKLFSDLRDDVIKKLIIRNGNVLFSDYICKAYYTEAHNNDIYIRQLATDFANNVIAVMDIVNKFDEIRYDEMDNYEKRVGYLFSETYSDLAMIKVFKISMKDYFNLYKKDLNTYPLMCDIPSNLSDIILTRFLTVCAVAYGEDNVCNIGDDRKLERVDEILAEACWSCNNFKKINEYAKKYKLDRMLMQMLYEYLEECGNKLENAFSGIEAAQCLQNEYQWLSDGNHTITDFLKQILNMEKNYTQN